jgi:hypothetical protein
MATQTETTIVHAAAVVQGIALVTFPAASAIFTDPAEYDLSSPVSLHPQLGSIGG